MKESFNDIIHRTQGCCEGGIVQTEEISHLNGEVLDA